MKNLKRALRRHHRSRLLKKRSGYWGRMNWDYDEPFVAVSPMVVNTPTPCSCPMCGNPRKHAKEKSLGERRMEQMIYRRTK